MSRLVNPHGGGDLKPLLLEGPELEQEQARAQSLPRVNVSSREAGDIIMMGIGGFTPLEGFMTHTDWQRVCVDVMRRAVARKFETHGDLRRALVETGAATLIEDSRVDYFWGIGADGSGKNMLGMVLMEVRATLMDEPTCS